MKELIPACSALITNTPSSVSIWMRKRTFLIDMGDIVGVMHRRLDSFYIDTVYTIYPKIQFIISVVKTETK